LKQMMKRIVVIGGTGAQGRPVVKELCRDGSYEVVVLTRDLLSSNSKELESLGNVTLWKGSYTSEENLHSLFKNAYGAFVNTNGFNLGEKAEIYWGIRIFEIAVEENVQHYLWSSLDYGLKKGGWNSKFHCGHYDSKGRVAEFIMLQRPSHKMKTSVLTSGPYLEMLWEGMFLPTKQPDGTFVFPQPIGDGAVPMISLDDLGRYARWIFDNPERTDGLDLEIATQHVTWNILIESFMKVNPDKKAIRVDIPLEEYFKGTGRKKDDPVTSAPNAEGAHDPTTQTFWKNFEAWWSMWRENIIKRDYHLLDEILPDRIRTVEEWMRVKGYDGSPKLLFQDKNRDIHA